MRPKTRKSKISEIVIILFLAFVIRTFLYGLYIVPTGSMETTMLVGESFFADKFTNLFTPIAYEDIISFNGPEYHYSENSFLNMWQRYVGPYPYIDAKFPFIHLEWGPSNWTKRVIGIPGDHMVGKVENGKPVVYRNGEKLDETYINKYPLLAHVKGNLSLDYRSYDPDYSYQNQPFYDFNPIEVKRAKKYLEAIDRPVLKYPGKPEYVNGRDVDIFDVHLGSDQYWAMGDNRRGSNDSRFWGPLDGSLIHGRIVLRLWSIDTKESWLILDILKHPFTIWKRIRWSRFFQLVH